jgi:hypothetical protein
MKIFVSYSQADEKWAQLLRSRLSQEGFEVWDPESDLAPGDNWRLKSGKALQSADAMIVLLSPEAAKSDWVQSEIDYALGSPHFRDRLIPLVVKPTEDIPWILRKQPLIRATKDVEETIRRVVASLHRSPEPAAR